MAFQTSVKRYQDKYYEGNIVQGTPYVIPGIIHVPDSGTPTTPCPGMPVIWDATLMEFKLPTTATESRNMDGIICTRKYDLPGGYKDEDQIEIMIEGIMVIKVGSAASWRQRLEWQTDDQKWDVVADPVMAALTGTTFNAAYRTSVKTNVDAALAQLYKLPVRVLDYGDPAADGDLVKVSVGIGR